MPLSRSPLLIAGFCAGLAPSMALAKVTAVTLFPDQATIEREERVTLEPGEGQVTIRNLSPGLQPESLRVALESGDGLVIRHVDSRRVASSQAWEARQRSLRETLQSLRDERQTLTDRIQVAQYRVDLVESRIAGQGTGDSASSGSDGLEARITESATDALATIRAVEKERRTLDQEIERVRKELEALGQGRKSSMAVTIEYVSPAAVDATAHLTYQTRSAGWSPAYEARLETADSKMALHYQADVRQQTGRDWEDVSMTLSTARVSAGGRLPDPPPYQVDLFEPRPEPAQEADAALKMAVPSSAGRARQETAKLEQRGMTRTWQLPGSVSLPSDGRGRRLTVSETVLDANVAVHAVPEINPAAYIHAAATYDGEAVLPAGSVNLIQDGVFTGQSHLDTIRPGGELDLSFGVDDRVRVDTRVADESRGTKGMLSGDAWVRRQLVFEVSNHHDQPVTLKVFGRLPVARHDDITVSTLELTKPSERDVDDKLGLLAWDLELAPGDHQDLTLGYEIAYPEEKTLRW
ncbi:uncharacterized protein (TIGR02231 family) [Tamilnaduibacter salinus]|uniref:Uncharacterized protein (TIGR02231 family) n=1 Tax=Tamilnaduibacter salinus TaxID=1484056 RepID=A0A2U1D1M4_9GAMM|nr:mucoidy inhibitor MuiA family protein [Tamilnaduibacter salinus]PVY79181.1 uncharacterized protein (TIGR02231 family) [Tamilnaduibacter salinus]